MSVDSRSFRKGLGCFPTGVTVATTMAGPDAPAGVTVSSFTSVSLEPPLVLFCLDNRNPLLPAFKTAGHFAINILRESQRETSILFASRLEEKWKDVSYKVGQQGSPILDGCLAFMECKTHQIVESGDHHIFIGQVEQIDYQQAGSPLVYFRGAYAELGCTVP